MEVFTDFALQTHSDIVVHSELTTLFARCGHHLPSIDLLNLSPCVYLKEQLPCIYIFD